MKKLKTYGLFVTKPNGERFQIVDDKALWDATHPGLQETARRLGMTPNQLAANSAQSYANELNLGPKMAGCPRVFIGAL